MLRQRRVVKPGAEEVIEVLVRSRKWANHKAYDRLPGRPLQLSGENVSGKAAARCDGEGSERQLLLRKSREVRRGGRRRKVDCGE